MIPRLIDACRQSLSIKACACFDEVFDPSFSMNAHNHITIELMCAVEGSFKHTFYIDKKPYKTIQTNKGQILLINTAVHHKLVISKQTHIQSIAFEFTRDSLDAFPLDMLCMETSGFNSLAYDDADWVTFNSCPSWPEIFNYLFELLILPKEELENIPDYKLMLKLGIGIFWSKLIFSHSMIKSSKKAYAYFNQAKSYIDANFTEPVTAESIASHVGLNRTYLQTLFKSVGNTTIVEYINNQRIIRACFLLRNTDWSIERIGFDVGFNSREHFSRTFRTITALSPGEYRKRINVKNYTEDDLFMIERLPGD